MKTADSEFYYTFGIHLMNQMNSHHLEIIFSKRNGTEIQSLEVNVSKHVFAPPTIFFSIFSNWQIFKL